MMLHTAVRLASRNHVYSVGNGRVLLNTVAATQNNVGISASTCHSRCIRTTPVTDDEEKTAKYTFEKEDLHSSEGFGTKLLPEFVKIVEVGPRDGLQVRISLFYCFKRGCK